MHMRRTSTTQRADNSRPDRERRSRRRAGPNSKNNEKQHNYPVPDPQGDHKTDSETAEFVALCQELASVNHFLLSYIDEFVASIRAPGTQPFIDELANRAESIRGRMSLMAELAAKLKDTSD